MSPSTLSAGPRGRRLLLELAMLLDDDLRAASHQRAFAIDYARGAAVFAFGWEDGEPVSGPAYEHRYAEEAPTAAQIAGALAGLELPQEGPGEAEFTRALTESVAASRYWQEPDGLDALTGLRELRAPMRRLAAWAAPHAPEAWDAPAAPEQHAVAWRDGVFPATGAAEWKAQTLEDEERSAGERPADVTANYSGTWWSFPDGVASSGAAGIGEGGGVPTALYWTEDASGLDSALTAAVDMTGMRILTVENTSAWNTLCWEQPLEVTASRRHDWYRVSGLDTRWVIPDWEVLAKKYDAVHMSVGAYLAGANHALTVDTGINTMIAGWGPGELRWLNPPRLGQSTRWTFDDEDLTWRHTP